MGAFVYIVRCSDGSLYTGWTTNVEQRVKTHNSGRGAKYTRTRLPVVLALSITLSDKSEAMRTECRVKRMTRKQKLELIDSQPTKA